MGTNSENGSTKTAHIPNIEKKPAINLKALLLSKTIILFLQIILPIIAGVITMSNVKLIVLNIVLKKLFVSMIRIVYIFLLIDCLFFILFHHLT